MPGRPGDYPIRLSRPLAHARWRGDIVVTTVPIGGAPKTLGSPRGVGMGEGLHNLESRSVGAEAFVGAVLHPDFVPLVRPSEMVTYSTPGGGLVFPSAP